MPRINIKTNVYISKKKKTEMFEDMKRVIDAIPYENGDYLMADFEGEHCIMFGDDPTAPCASIEVMFIDRIYEKLTAPGFCASCGSDHNPFEDALEAITLIVSQYLQIPGTQIFTILKTVPLWAYDGVNIEKGLLNLD